MPPWWSDKMKQTLLIVLGCLFLYQGVLWWTPYASVLPSIPLLIQDYAVLLMSYTWVQALGVSLLHSLILLLFLGLCCMGLVIIGLSLPWVKTLVHQISEWMASTPTIAVLLIGLILFGLSQSVNIIVSFIVWPLVYERINYALTSLTEDELDVMKIFAPTFIEEWVNVRLARVVDELGSMMNTIFPTTLKILIMVEVLHSQTSGYGHLYQLARQNFQIERLLTLTFHLIVILKILKTLTCYFFHKST